MLKRFYFLHKIVSFQVNKIIMRYFLIIKLVFLLSTLLKAEKYILDSSSNVTSEHIELTKNLKSTTVSIENRWTDSLGKYGTGKCNGHILTENKKISLTVFCEATAASGEKFWTQLLRDKDMKAGKPPERYLKAVTPSLIHYAIGTKKPLWLNDFLPGLTWKYDGFLYQAKYELKDILYDKTWQPPSFKSVQKKQKHCFRLCVCVYDDDAFIP